MAAAASPVILRNARVVFFAWLLLLSIFGLGALAVYRARSAAYKSDSALPDVGLQSFLYESSGMSAMFAAPSPPPQLSATATPTASGSPTLSPTPAVDAGAAAWLRNVTFRHWHGPADVAKEMGTCENVLRDFWPKPDSKYSNCDTFFGGNPSVDSFRPFVTRMYATPCTYRGSHTATTELLAVPSRSARVYVVYATSAPVINTHQGTVREKPYESVGARKMRIALRAWSLRTLREQFGDAIEITVVQFDDEVDDEDSYGGPGVVNTLIRGTLSEGQDWAMFQEGLQAAWHRLDAFEWVLIVNDQLTGPVAFLPDVLDLASESGAGLYVASSWKNCCIRGFMVGFHKKLVATESWRTYWERMSWPCAKLGPMYMGEEGATRLPQTQWQWHGGCATSTTSPIGKGHSLAKQRREAPHSPFIYRWALEMEWLRDAAMSDAAVDAAVETALAWLDATRVDAHVTDCGLGNRGNGVGTYARERRGGTSAANDTLTVDEEARAWPGSHT